ncbi:hypothetical protein V6N11_035301 [Hibiscus sabdariffa]|uniref:Uncharacterized protein n=1 Tax=Hibiscus sabdariffa TaxID=183260 RepID=A0ABR2R004_9ROSI
MSETKKRSFGTLELEKQLKRGQQQMGSQRYRLAQLDGGWFSFMVAGKAKTTTAWLTATTVEMGMVVGGYTRVRVS